MVVLVTERAAHRRIDQRPRCLRLGRQMLALHRAVRTKHRPGLRLDAQFERPDIYAGPAEQLDDFWLEDDTPTTAVQIVWGAFVDIDAPSRTAQQRAGEKAAKRAADNQRASSRLALGVQRRNNIGRGVGGDGHGWLSC
jgi:hypothetical protein